jgi:hypothetical protein
MREQHALIWRRGRARFDKLGRWMGDMTTFLKTRILGCTRERWSYCCFGNEQDSIHGAAMQLVAREREAGDGFPLAPRCAKHLFFSLCDVCILE